MNPFPLRNKAGLTEAEFLDRYNPDQYKNPSVTVDVLVFTVTSEAEQNERKVPGKELKLLMIKRADHPYIGHVAFPGGFVGEQESLDDAARRELEEETKVAGLYLEQLYTWGDPKRDPRKRIISTSYVSLVDSSNLGVEAGDDASDARWYVVKTKEELAKRVEQDKGYVMESLQRVSLESDVDQVSALVKVTKSVQGRYVSVEREVIERDGIAFDHAAVILYAIDHLKKKIEWTDVAFQLVPERFTLEELQQVYELILGKEIGIADLRRKIAPMVIETNQKKTDAAHRPAQFFRFNPNWNADEQ
ncbi:NUDIX domain-containing protein [Heliobacterium gestii]|uniref:NUDIX domain-containing protein n=1 Tax=Heliomicrobium gestii TaxID=2699 RepID=A0A845LCY9_HELGE|nr:NUDIX hydrolase [Heliomicrobium gestii]MBM7867665.1 ADP-ribose pyrophosphatase YjhB (NUDIX family) [Heliomicrobium gestii]MZP44058.1 NUDIX domain-containing protein [Heliomicrobium gestii]